MTTPLTTKVVGANPVLLYGAQGGATIPMQVRNTDATRIVWVGNVSNVQADGSNSIPLNPGDSVSFDGSSSIYAISPAGAMIVAVTPGGLSYAPGTVDITGPVTISGPVTVTGNLNVTGVGGTFPIGGSASVLNVSGQAIGAGGAFLSAALDMLNYTAFNITGYAYCTTQGTPGAPLTTQVNFAWYADAGLTQLLESIAGQVWVANANGGFGRFYISGPCHGRYLAVNIINGSGTVAMTLGNLQVYGTGRTINDNRWSQIPPYGNITSGVTIIGQQGPEDPSMPAALVNFSLAAGATQWYPLVLSNRIAFFQLSLSAPLGNNPVLNTAFDLQNGQVVAGATGLYEVWNPGNAAAAITTRIDLPYYPTYMVFHNSSAGAINIGLTAITNGS